MQPLAEVVSSSVTSIVAQKLNKAEEGDDGTGPSFGSFVRIESGADKLQILAVVHNVVTAPTDSVHRTSAFGLDREALRLEQPQIFSLLRTDLHAAIVGYMKGASAVHHLPPHPPDVHDFVYPADNDMIAAITSNFEFLRLLAAVTSVPADELLAAAVREAYRARRADQSYLIKAGQAFSQLFRSDYERLVSVIGKIRPES